MVEAIARLIYFVKIELTLVGSVCLDLRCWTGLLCSYDTDVACCSAAAACRVRFTNPCHKSNKWFQERD
jgi:hypothetical protein